MNKSQQFQNSYRTTFREIFQNIFV